MVYVSPDYDEISEVRFLIQDTSLTTELFTDSEINYVLEKVQSNVYTAAKYLCQILVARFSAEADTEIESVKIAKSQRSKQYRALMLEIGQLQALAGQNGNIAIPLIGGISKADIASTESDTDRVPDTYSRNQFDNPPTPPVV